MCVLIDGSSAGFWVPGTRLSTEYSGKIEYHPSIRLVKYLASTRIIIGEYSNNNRIIQAQVEFFTSQVHMPSFATTVFIFPPIAEEERVCETSHDILSVP